MKKEDGTKKWTTKKVTSKKQPTKQLPTEQITTEQLPTKQEVGDKKNHKPLAISLFIVIIIIGLIIYFNNDETTIEPQIFKQDKIGKNTCYFSSIALKYNSFDIFTCDTNDDCINSLKEYHKITATPLPSQNVLERIECLP